MSKSVLSKLIVFIVASALVVGALCAGYFFYSMQSLSAEREAKAHAFVYGEKKVALRNQVRLAYETVKAYYDRSQDIEGLKKARRAELKKIIDAVASQLSAFYERNKDAMPREDLEREMRQLVSGVRYDGDNYIWIHDTSNTMVMHPIKPALDGRNLNDFKDPAGKLFFNEMTATAKEQGEGVVEYLWPKPGEEEAKLKISFVKLVPGVNWILGTGAWIEDIVEQMKAAALVQVANMRLSDGNYFWINDMRPYMVMHPIKPALDGKDLSGFADPKGKKLFVEMAEVCKKDGAGFVEYWWPKPGQEGDFPKLSYVRLFEPWGWIIGMGVYTDDVDIEVATQTEEFVNSLHGLMLKLGLFGGVALALSLGLVLLQARRDLSVPLKRVVAWSGKVAEGDLDAQISGTFKGELAELKDSVGSMVESLREQMEQAHETSRQAEEKAQFAETCRLEAEEAKAKAEAARREGMLEAAGMLEQLSEDLIASTDELKSLVRQASEGADRQLERASDTARAMAEMNSAVLDVAHNASDATQGSTAARDKANEGAGIVEQSVAAISEVNALAQNLRGNVEQLGEKAQAIGQVMTVISDIADQTNLLALNAAIEAARAGDAGRGFAVVADEVRKLAEKTMTATHEVGDAVAGIQDGISANVQDTERAAEAVDRATELIGASGGALHEIVDLVQASSDQVSNIAAAAEEQSASSEEINQAVEAMHDISQETATGMAQSGEAIRTLSELAESLQELIGAMRK